MKVKRKKPLFAVEQSVSDRLKSDDDNFKMSTCFSFISIRYDNDDNCTTTTRLVSVNEFSYSIHEHSRKSG